MTTKTKKSSKNAADAPRTRCEQATNALPTRSLFVPIMGKFRAYLRKDVATAPQIWLPIECNLVFRYEFAACSIQTRYIFVAILLYCGQRGIDEIPDDKRFLASALNADARTIEKAIPELENFKLLLERKKEREKKKPTDQTDGADENGVVVVVGDFNSFSETKAEAENQKKTFGNKLDSGSSRHLSRFTLEECLKYAKQSDGVKNPNALANNLYQTGNADAFIMAMLYPADALAEEAKIYGEPTKFTNEPCAICFGAKMADVDGKGYRKCVHCQDERGKSTGFLRQGESE